MTMTPQGNPYGYGPPAQPGLGHPLTRTDSTGRSISFGDRQPRTRSVLYTGGPGMGTSFELNRAVQFANQRDWAVIRVDASSREPLENRFARTVGDQLGHLRKRYGFFAVRGLKKTVQKLLTRKQGTQNGLELRTPSPGGLLPQIVTKRQWDAKGSEDPGRTLNDIADQIGQLADKRNSAALIVIDKVDQASDRDLAAINELAAHLERSGQPVQLVMGGGVAAPTRLMHPSMMASGIETDIGRLYDIRDCRPFADWQLQWAANDYMSQRGIPIEPAAVQTLAQSANGNLARLQRDAEVAASLAQPPYGVTQAVAQHAVRVENERDARIYEAKWNNSTDAERTLMTQAAQRGPQGIDVRRMAANLGDTERNELLATAKRLEFRGVFREENGRMTFADEGMAQRVITEVGNPAVYQGVPINAPDLAPQEQGQPAQQPDPRWLLAGQVPPSPGQAQAPVQNQGTRPDVARGRAPVPGRDGGRSSE